MQVLKGNQKKFKGVGVYPRLWIEITSRDLDVLLTPSLFFF
jgi:hypothetical protein